MNRKAVSALTIAFLSGLLAVTFLSRSPVHAERAEAAPKWEYKVVRIASDQQAESKRIETMTRQMNEAAAEGWEYVGLVAVPVRKPYDFSGDGYVAFRRPKE